ncbi:MAG TPA: RsmD family RNA methyltransferase, partial [Acidobacteriota bacterium]|nr:RsmD family RNA methyltransferase [Acidobacteriota bacterium]
MRIISGRFKGRRLAAVKGDVRPTSDRLRESLFSALAPWLQGAVWLDAFAGSGAVGLEALSRGAELVVFNEK